MKIGLKRWRSGVSPDTKVGLRKSKISVEILRGQHKIVWKRLKVDKMPYVTALQSVSVQKTNHKTSLKNRSNLERLGNSTWKNELLEDKSYECHYTLWYSHWVGTISRRRNTHCLNIPILKVRCGAAPKFESVKTKH